ncbi:MAG: hypothetical protein WC100_22255 [Sterolibacterium sp.]
MANVLMTFGFSWMVVAAIIGFLLAKRHEVSLAQLEKIAAAGNLAEYHRVNDGYKWNKTIHAHAFLFSVVAVLVGLVIPKMAYSPMVTDGLAIALMCAAVVWTLGSIRSLVPIMAIGDFLLLGSVATSALGLARAL